MSCRSTFLTPLVVLAFTVGARGNISPIAEPFTGEFSESWEGFQFGFGNLEPLSAFDGNAEVTGDNLIIYAREGQFRFGLVNFRAGITDGEKGLGNSIDGSVEIRFLVGIRDFGGYFAAPNNRKQIVRFSFFDGEDQLLGEDSFTYGGDDGTLEWHGWTFQEPVHRIEYSGPGVVGDAFQLRLFPDTNTPPEAAGFPALRLDPRTGPYIVDLSAGFTDQETPGNQLHYQVVSADGPGLVSALFIDSEAAALTVHVSPARMGQQRITVRATDAGGLSAEAVILLEVDGGNPTFTEHPAGLQVDPGTEAVFSALADGLEPLQYQWYKDGESLAGARDPTLTLINVTSSDAGVYNVVASNPNGAVTSETAVLQVDALAPPGGNRLPVATGLEELVLLEDAEVTRIPLSGHFFDSEDGVDLTFSLASEPALEVIATAEIETVAGQGASLVIGTRPDGHGKEVLQVRATDRNGGFVDAPFTVRVKPVNDGPVALPIPDVRLVAGGAGTLLPLADYFDDIDDPVESLSFRVIEIRGDPLFDATPIVDGELRFVLGDRGQGAGGSAELSVVASDPGGRTARGSLRVEVTPAMQLAEARPEELTGSADRLTPGRLTRTVQPLRPAATYGSGGSMTSISIPVPRGAPGEVYRVEFKASLRGSWVPVAVAYGGDVFTDTNPGRLRAWSGFYRMKAVDGPGQTVTQRPTPRPATAPTQPNP